MSSKKVKGVDIKKLINGEQELPAEKFIKEKTKIKVTGNIRIIVIGVLIGTIVFGGGAMIQAISLSVEASAELGKYVDEQEEKLGDCIGVAEKLMADTSRDSVKDSSTLDKLQEKIDEAKKYDSGKIREELSLSYGSGYVNGGGFYECSSLTGSNSGYVADSEYYNHYNTNYNTDKIDGEIREAMNNVLVSKETKTAEDTKAKAEEAKRKAEEEAKQYITISEWGVKWKVPEAVQGKISYTYSSAYNEAVFRPSFDPSCMLSGVQRWSSSKTFEPQSAPVFLYTYDSYYFYIADQQAVCQDGTDGGGRYIKEMLNNKPVSAN